jgi:hypothetical protein
LHQSLKLTATTMMIAVVGAVSLCVPDNVARPAEEPAMPQQALAQPGAFVRTTPLRPVGAKRIESTATTTD